MCRARFSSPGNSTFTTSAFLAKDGRIVFVNTLYNCLATPSERHSFTPLWKPSYFQDRQGGPLPPERPRHAGRRAALRHGGRPIRHLRRLARRPAGGAGRAGASLVRRSVDVRTRRGFIATGCGCSIPAPASWAGSAGAGEGKGQFHGSPSARLCAGSPSRQLRHRRAVAAALPALRGAGPRSPARGRGLRGVLRRGGGRPRPRPASTGSASTASSPSSTTWPLPGVLRPMALGFASNEILGLITHDPLEDGSM